MSIRSLFATTALSLVSCTAFASNYTESVSGDLSSNNLAPSFLSLSVGDNVVTGTTMNGANFDRDFFTVIVGAGQTLDSIILNTYAGPAGGTGSFFAVQQGTQVNTLYDASALLGNALIGKQAGATPGSDVLDNLGGAVFGGAGFSGPLTTGTYTFWIQETAGPMSYALNFHLTAAPIPEPETYAMLLAGLGLMAGVARRRKIK